MGLVKEAGICVLVRRVQITVTFERREIMKQFNTMNKLSTHAKREQLMFHPQADRMVSFNVVLPGFDTGFAAPSDKCLLRHAHRMGWPMGPALAKEAAKAADSWGK